MKAASISRLNQLNLDFYARVAESFDATRSFAWTGWTELRPFVHHLATQAADQDRPLKILDLGCGNGRFGAWLTEALAKKCRLDYTGLDTNQFLLDQARTTLESLSGVDHHLRSANIVELLLHNQFAELFSAKFDLIVAFGLIHHVPGSTQRYQLVESMLTQLLAPNGLAVFTLWQFDSLPNLFARAKKLSETDLIDDAEENDYLLDWQRNQSGKSETLLNLKNLSQTPRYCHLVTETEVTAWLEMLANTDQASSRHELVLDYLADGPKNLSNRYLVFQKSHQEPPKDTHA